MAALFHPALCRFLILYGVLYAGFGVQSPYLPTFLGSRGLSPEAIALVLAASGAVRLVAGPAAGRFADRLDAPRAAKKAAERWLAKNPPEAYRDIIRVWGVLNTHRPPGQTSWSRAIVRHGADPGEALAAVLGVPAEDIRATGR
jgi:MFS family permease